jgi:hypothetical protein
MGLRKRSHNEAYLEKKTPKHDLNPSSASPQFFTPALANQLNALHGNYSKDASGKFTTHECDGYSNYIPTDVIREEPPQDQDEPMVV